MQKPTIFFSHSSKDKKFISELRKIIIDKTSGTIEIFQSSDGESIPFGRNWVHKIEDGLLRAKLMFVFISPNSVNSTWIYFESGFSYAKDIRVIPIGIGNLDIGSIAPPLNLLQGFNLKNHEGVNNIITILNNEFSTSYKADVDDVIFRNYQNDDGFDDVESSIDVVTCVINDYPNKPLVDNPYEVVKQYFLKCGMSLCGSKDSRSYVYGLELICHKNERSNKEQLIFRMDLSLLDENLVHLNNMLSLLYDSPMEWLELKLVFNQYYYLITENYKVSSLLRNTGAEMLEKNGLFYDYTGLKFTLISQNSHLLNKNEMAIIYEPNAYCFNELKGLLKMLFKSGVIGKYVG